jgi:hypothetical protein
MRRLEENALRSYREREREQEREREKEREDERERERERTRRRERELERQRELEHERQMDNLRIEKQRREAARLEEWTKEFRRMELLRAIRTGKIKAKRSVLHEQQFLLRRRKQVLQHIGKQARSLRHFMKRKDVKDVGTKLLWRGLRSVATHSLLTVCTKGLGTKFALLVDKDNYVHVGKLTVVRSALLEHLRREVRLC